RRRPGVRRRDAVDAAARRRWRAGARRRRVAGAMRLLRIGLLAACAAFGALAPVAVAAATSATAPLQGHALGDALRRGGYVLYFRHTSTDFGQSDETMTSFEDCNAQRNLTDKGRDEARAIGAAIQRDRIPVGDVLASPYCRT